MAANATSISSIVEAYNTILSQADPRVERLWLMQSPLPIAAICLTYIYVVLYLGPRLMKNREPFNLRKVLIVYNAFQTVFSAVHFYLSLNAWIQNYGLGLQCYKMDFNDQSPQDYYLINLCYIYFLSKLTELCDTLFFVMKKKNKHVSLLHVFHHAAMPFSVWFGVKFHPGGNLAFFGIPNLFVHIWMYLYYMLAAMGPQYNKYIWWKRHITEMQLGQFALVMVYMLYVTWTCNFSKVLVSWIFVLDVAFVILFLDFYWKSYKRRQAKGVTIPADEKKVNGSVANGTMNGTANGLISQKTENGIESLVNGVVRNADCDVTYRKTNGCLNGHVANGNATGVDEKKTI